MKKRYTFTFDEKMIDELKAFLKPKGIYLSTYLNSIINENMKVIEVLQGVNDLKDLSLGKLMEFYAGMTVEIDKGKKERKK